MYAVIKSGGKQYRVQEGDTLKIEKIDADEGTQFVLDQVLLIASDGNTQIGTPYIENAKVDTTVKSHGRGKKVKIIKFRRRKHSKKQMGHRQYFTELHIDSISAS
ncbi:50S ribosomal protein L21 [Candidatus Nitrosacidococcus tergens]|uniref:Large ribosomal subunit protein bL21 n=1 Tax=Candidatus Nitrosacidococcus tergens TaxID=553981 RepID=A0A7G1QBS2_9GAMM|nr:50S ribosomal protein L21 [Candidatus Nitrosacidococcus tergens]CAB1277514.1 50S ribosomal subunit protein L21 [Candidatus Nitrosacidococcus tergens]